ncbi:MAG: type VII secretion protein EccB [Corynebacterium sp.]|uniref:type VII secretion protein EccB n=1 Tax=Corynebacterium sp. TaxID=1720 RepID=UPI0026E0310B|nr:type VII secretion protein EccB [Corynebacterium sp.]MDO5670790.1 type VII secretion protein EccB [Corynebacterium sp.]
MTSTLMPTTRAQVSGHRFLRRRVEHGLVLGDIRMIHDPLATRSRALTFGVVAVVMISVGAGLMAWLRPAPDPGEAPILQTADGALFVAVDAHLHPVANLASARLIAGGAEEPARVGASVLADMERGVPVGIHPAPLVLAGQATVVEAAWSACATTDTVTVAVGEHTNPLGGHRGVLAVGGGREWMLTAAGRHELPGEHTPEGRILRRALGITAASPRWEPPEAVLTTIAERDPYRLPEHLPEEILDTGAGQWALLPEGVAPLREIQAEILADAGVPWRSIAREELAGYPDASLPMTLPPLAPQLLDPAEVTVCSTDTQVTTLHSDTAPVRLSGNGVADEFLSTLPAAVAVDTGHGHHVVDVTGLRHTVPTRADLEALGLPAPLSAPWPVVRLLPEGPELSQAAALQAAY